MKLVSAAPASFLSDACALQVALGACAKAEPATRQNATANTIDFIETSRVAAREPARLESLRRKCDKFVPPPPSIWGHASEQPRDASPAYRARSRSVSVTGHHIMIISTENPPMPHPEIVSQPEKYWDRLFAPGGHAA